MPAMRMLDMQIRYYLHILHLPALKAAFIDGDVFAGDNQLKTLTDRFTSCSANAFKSAIFLLFNRLHGFDTLRQAQDDNAPAEVYDLSSLIPEDLGI